MKLLRLITFILSLVITTGYAREINLRTEAEGFKRDFQRGFFLHGLTEDIFKLLEQKTSFRLNNFIDKAHTDLILNTSATDELKVDMVFIEIPYISKQAENLRKAIDDVAILRTQYHEKKKSVESLKFEHEFIDRMDCEKTKAKCFNIMLGTHALKYRIPFFPTYSYINDNIEQYLDDPKAFNKLAMTELDIKIPEYKWVEKVFGDVPSDLTQEQLEEAFNFMVTNLAEFIIAQNQYYDDLDMYLTETSARLNIEFEEIAPRDELKDDRILKVTGELEYGLSFVQYANAYGELDLTPLFDYFDSLDFKKYLR